MRSLPLLTAGIFLTVLMACGRGSDQVAEDQPIIVEDAGPIPLAENQPVEDEVDFVEEEPEPEVITRTIVIREPAPAPAPARTPEPEPAPEPEETAVEEVAPEPPPRVSEIPYGTQIAFSLLDRLDSENNEVGDEWVGQVTNDVVVDGQIVIAAGATVTGSIAEIEEGDSNGGQGWMILVANSVDTVDGRRAFDAVGVPAGESYEVTGGFPAKETGIGAGAGAIIGAIIGGKKGAAIGAGAGAAGGAVMGSARDDYEVSVREGTVVTIVLDSGISL